MAQRLCAVLRQHPQVETGVIEQQLKATLQAGVSEAPGTGLLAWNAAEALGSAVVDPPVTSQDQQGLLLQASAKSLNSFQRSITCRQARPSTLTLPT